MPIGHLGINVPDLETARRYYDNLMPALGFETFLVDHDQHAYRPAGGKPGSYLFLYGATDRSAYSRHATGLQHIAFMVETRSQVDAIHDLVRSLDSPVVHAPRDWPEYPPPYYAVFWLDCHGFMLEAVCHHDRD